MGRTFSHDIDDGFLKRESQRLIVVQSRIICHRGNHVPVAIAMDLFRKNQGE